MSATEARAAAPDPLGLEEPDDGLGQGGVVRVPTASQRGGDTGFGQALRVPDRQILRTAVAMVHQAVQTWKGPRMLGECAYVLIISWIFVPLNAAAYAEGELTRPGAPGIEIG